MTIVKLFRKKKAFFIAFTIKSSFRTLYRITEPLTGFRLRPETDKSGFQNLRGIGGLFGTKLTTVKEKWRGRLPHFRHFVRGNTATV